MVGITGEIVAVAPRGGFSSGAFGLSSELRTDRTGDTDFRTTWQLGIGQVRVDRNVEE